jgi:hypothetical protein
LLGVSFSTTDLAEVLDYQTRSWKACTIFEHTFKNKPDGASKSAIFRKPCPIFEHTFRVWCSIFDHQTQMTLHIERLLTVSVRNSNTSLENRVLFSNTFLESVIENRTPQGSVGRTCTIFEHRSGLGCAKFDHLARGIQAFSTYSPKYGTELAVAGDFLKTVSDNIDVVTFFNWSPLSIYAGSEHIPLHSLRSSCLSILHASA